MTEMREVWVNDRWPLLLPSHRADRPVWDHWEAGRLASMWHHLGQPYAANFYTDDGTMYRAHPLTPTGEVVYDIGAEEGDFPALFSSWGCDVVLFEPNDRVWPNIKAIWDANQLRPPLSMFAGFAGPEDRGSIILPDNCEYEGGLVGWPGSADGEVIHDHGFKTIPEYPEIPMVRIDTVVDMGIKPPTAITIDCEGSELQVLLGARSVLAEHRPRVWVSVHREFMAEQYGDTPEQLLEFMESLDYERTHICYDHESHEMFLPR